MMNSALAPSRRGFLQGSLATAAGLAVGSGVPNLAAAAAPTPASKRVLRVAHLTDVHVQPELAADQGLVQCLRHVQSHADAPDLILTGGDSIMDSFAASKDRTKVQWKLWNQILKDECALPVKSAIGNHDLWGWNKQASGATGNEKLYGKQWAVEEFNIPSRYYSFDQAGWHFVMLDSVFPSGSSYIGKLDDEQFDWLASDLSKTPADRPVLVVSHIPLVTAAGFFAGDTGASGTWKVPAAWMHIDALRIKNLFAKHPNVKLCLSGHLHLIDRVDYNGVSYLCNGAVSGAWWRGNHQECDEGYAVLDLYADGSFQREYVSYDWKPRA